LTTTTTGLICTATTRRGLPCRAFALSNSAFCFRHAPGKAKERRRASSKGGHARHGRKVGDVGPPSEPVKVETVADIIKLLESEINVVLGLEKSLSRAGTIARLALAFVKCFEVGENEARILELERRLDEKS